MPGTYTVILTYGAIGGAQSNPALEFSFQILGVIAKKNTVQANVVFVL